MEFALSTDSRSNIYLNSSYLLFLKYCIFGKQQYREIPVVRKMRQRLPSDEPPISKLESSLVPTAKVLPSVKGDQLESEGALSKGFDLPTGMFGEARRRGDSFRHMLPLYTLVKRK